MTYSFIFIPVLGTEFGVNILTRIDLYLKLIVAPFKRAVENHDDHFAVIVLERLVLDIDVLRLCPFSNSVPVLPVLRTIFGNMNPEKNLAAPGILALLFAQFLAPSGLG
jgi:hypothetical protein